MNKPRFRPATAVFVIASQLLTMAVSVGPPSQAWADGGASPGPADREARRAACLQWLDRGYPSGLEEVSCRSEFNLPSPFLLVCARGLRLGFRDALQRDACVAYFADQGRLMADGYVKG
ncbi:MAG: hypothetical protein AAFR16_08550 [Pseudomonadota bacterium]